LGFLRANSLSEDSWTVDLKPRRKRFKEKRNYSDTQTVRGKGNQTRSSDGVKNVASTRKNVIRRFYAATKIGLLALALSLAPFQPLLATPVKNVTYEQFEQLLKEKTAQIPELQELWSWRASSNEPVYLGGGILRGLLKWLEIKLRHSSFEQVRQTTVPTVQELLIQKNADMDLYHDRYGKAWFQNHMPQYGDWDILTKDFREQSIEAGGPAIEKIRVSPDQVEDPLGGLRAFYEGKLPYVDVPEKVFKKFRGERGTLNSNMKSALVLRELRFANEMPSVEIDEDTSRRLHAAVDSELTRIQPRNYWIQKTLKKFHASTGDDIQKTLQILRNYGLLKTLAVNAYSLGEEKASWILERKYLLLQLPPNEISDEEFNVFKKSSNDIGAVIEGMKHLLAKADNPKRVVSIFSPGVESPNDKYRTAISKLILSSTGQLQKLKLSPSDLSPLKTISNRIGTNIALMRLGIQSSGNPSEFFEAIQMGVSEPSVEYKTAVQKLMGESIHSFMDLNPTVEEMDRFKSISNNIKANITLMRNAIRKAASAEEFLRALNPAVKSPSPAYAKAISELAIENQKRFLKLEPTIIERSKFEAQFDIRLPDSKPNRLKCFIDTLMQAVTR
jgi:hypothetical protein